MKLRLTLDIDQGAAGAHALFSRTIEVDPRKLSATDPDELDALYVEISNAFLFLTSKSKPSAAPAAESGAVAIR